MPNITTRLLRRRNFSGFRFNRGCRTEWAAFRAWGLGAACLGCFCSSCLGAALGILAARTLASLCTCTIASTVRKMVSLC